MSGKSLNHHIALPEATEDFGVSTAEVHLHPRDKDSPVVVHKILGSRRFPSLEAAHHAAKDFIDNVLLDADESGEMELRKTHKTSGLPIG